MKILLGIFLLLATYYVILFLFVFKGNGQLIFFFRKKQKKDVVDSIPIESLNQPDVVGKSKGHASQTVETPILELEMEVEYIEEFQQQEDLDEETMELEEQGFSDYSSGITFEELQKVMDAVQSEHIPEETEPEAGEIISNLVQTDMFELLLQFSDGNKRVNDLLKKHVDRF